MRTNRKRLVAAVSVILVLVFAFTMTGCGGGNAGSVVNTFFDAIDKQDVKKFYSCFEKDMVDDLKDYFDDDDLKDMLEEMDEMLTDEYGKNWRKKVKVGKAEKVDKDDDITYYEVEVSIDGEDEEYIEVIKVKGKYYLDEDAFGGLY